MAGRPPQSSTPGPRWSRSTLARWDRHPGPPPSPRPRTLPSPPPLPRPAPPPLPTAIAPQAYAPTLGAVLELICDSLMESVLKQLEEPAPGASSSQDEPAARTPLALTDGPAARPRSCRPDCSRWQPPAGLPPPWPAAFGRPGPPSCSRAAGRRCPRRSSDARVVGTQARATATTRAPAQRTT